MVAMASAVATAVFILACNGGPRPASGQSCPAWEISFFKIAGNASECPSGYPAFPAGCRISDGWEPFAYAPDAMVLRRCAR
jgi:hypothetical protein